ncbi:methionine ABC transporter permease [Bifidobacterium goeldii]|uniref:Methionine ABC transporter permease n=1 Tax=Bifidobacterium goeldii TaxID=2306975 RepID=A0A430FMG4_9BIFI|nr:methionine ABC transporter permease [Bifidobacterium goeldii]RSX54099.1 methionine ABC transporter permease [Bifidobacterium goeldii]
MMSDVLNTLLPNVSQIWPEVWEATGETVYMVVVGAIIGYAIGLVFGLLLLLTGRGGLLRNAIVYNILDKAVNILRSIPFIILMALLVGVTRVIVGTSIGTNAMIVPIVGATIPFYARQVENALLEIDNGLVEAAKASGLGTLDIIWRVYLREGRVPIIRVSALSFINVVAFSAMAGVVGGGGLGNLAIIRGYNRFQGDVTLVATLIILIIVFISQFLCNWLARRLQH